MKRFVTVKGVATLVVPCPVGKQVRLLSLVAAIGSAEAAGDGMQLQYTIGGGTSGQVVAGVAISTVNDATYTLYAAVGLSFGGDPLQVGFVVATGATQWQASALTRTIPLPDVWFNQEVIVVFVGNDTATPTVVVGYYEERDAQEWTPGRARARA